MNTINKGDLEGDKGTIERIIDFSKNARKKRLKKFQYFDKAVKKITG